MRTERVWGSTTVRIIQGDILSLTVDAIVNPANNRLLHGGGLAAAIVRKGGQIIQEESDRLAPVATGDAVITSAGRLPCRFVIHTVGPVQGEGDEDAKIRRAFLSVLTLATERRLASLAIPAVSTGIFGYPAASCAREMYHSLRDFLTSRPTSLREILVCLLEDGKYRTFLEVFDAEDRRPA